jgi:hypothetical protein
VLISPKSEKQEHFEPPTSSTPSLLITKLALSSKLEITFSSNNDFSSRTESPQPPNAFGGQGMLPSIFTLNSLKPGAQSSAGTAVSVNTSFCPSEGF